MTISAISVIMGRIAAATEASPIAVFAPPERTNYKTLDAVFGATQETRRRINSKDPTFIGLFHKNMDRTEVAQKLHAITHQLSVIPEV